MNIIRTRQDIPDTEQQVVLDGVTYRIRLTYRGYLESWYMDFSTQDRTPILTGVRLEPGANLLLLADTQTAPAGMLLVVQTGSVGDTGTRSTVDVICSNEGETVGLVLHPGHLFADPAGNLWTPTIDVPLPANESRRTTFESVEHAPIAVASGAVLEQQVVLDANLAVSASAASVQGKYPSDYVRADLGNGMQLIYVPASEYPS